MEEKNISGGSSRTKNSALNLVFSLGGKIIDLVIRFVLRTVFIHTLGQEYLGLSGLFTNILSFLSLAELGVGTAITFSLYKPLAENDERQLAILMRIYKKTYIIIGIIVLAAGSALTPFLGFFINDMPDIPHIRLIYLLFVLNSGISYFYSYKSSYIIANQKGYVVTNNQYLMSVICAILQVIELYVFKSYIGYLIVQVVFTVFTNVRISRIADKMYPVLKVKTDEALDDGTKHTILSNVGAMVFHRVGAIIVFSTDNILLSKMFNLIIVGLYSNYTMIITALEGILNQFFSAITASIGNLGVESDQKHQNDVFYEVFFLDFWMYSFSTVALGTLFQPFIRLWLGNDYLMSTACVFFIVLNFYLKGMRQAAMTFDTAYGMMRFYKYMPIPECIVNLVTSVLIALWLGPVGIFIGTTLSTLCAPLWMEPRVLFKHGLKSGSLGKYFLRYAAYAAFTFGAFLITNMICMHIGVAGLGGFVLKVLVVVIVPNLLICVCFMRTKEFRYVVNLLKNFIPKAHNRKKA